MRAVAAPFGGVRVESATGTLAVNGGGTLAELERFYLAPPGPPVAMILTTEHLHRSRNAAEFSDRHGIPLIGSLIALARLHVRTPNAHGILPPRRLTAGQFDLDLFHVRYDSLDPFALTVAAEGETLGIVPDGKLSEKYPEALQKLRGCQKLFLGNKMDRPPAASRYLFLRCRSCYNTSAELAEIFRDHRGELTIDPNCH